MGRLHGTGQGWYSVSMYFEKLSHCAAVPLGCVIQLNPGFQLAQSQSLAPKSAVILLKTID